MAGGRSHHAPVEPQALVPTCIGHAQKMLRLVGRKTPLVRSWVRAAATRAPVEPQAMGAACIGHVQKLLRLVCRNAPLVRSWVRAEATRTGGAPSNGTSVHWACAENAAFSGSKRTSRTMMGARWGGARTMQQYKVALGTCRKRCV